MMAILRDLCRRGAVSVLASMHDVDLASKASDRVALIKSGQLQSVGPPEQVLTGRAVAQLYDFQAADFDRTLGSIELRGDGRRGRAFVAAGLGSGAPVYRMLARRGFDIATGVLHRNDVDYYVARSLGAECVSQPAMEAVGRSALAAAESLLDRCAVVIDCGFALGPLNRGNRELVQTALRKGKLVLSLRENSRGFPASPVRCRDLADLLETLDRRMPADALPNPGAEAPTEVP
jgi:iron complex transport system ATP-binding protein